MLAAGHEDPIVLPTHVLFDSHLRFGVPTNRLRSHLQETLQEILVLVGIWNPISLLEIPRALYETGNRGITKAYRQDGGQLAGLFRAELPRGWNL